MIVIRMARFFKDNNSVKFNARNCVYMIITYFYNVTNRLKGIKQIQVYYNNTHALQVLQITLSNNNNIV